MAGFCNQILTSKVELEKRFFFVNMSKVDICGWNFWKNVSFLIWGDFCIFQIFILDHPKTHLFYLNKKWNLSHISSIRVCLFSKLWDHLFCLVTLVMFTKKQVFSNSTFEVNIWKQNPVLSYALVQYWSEWSEADTMLGIDWKYSKNKSSKFHLYVVKR
jgi:hypothetical protein